MLLRTIFIKTRKAISCSAVALGVLALSGCERPVSPGIIVFNSIGDEAWLPTQIIEVKPFDVDSVAAASLRPDSVTSRLWVRYNSKAPQNVSIIVESEDYYGPLRSDTLTIPLYAADGHPLGNGTYGLYEAFSPLPVSIPLPEGISITLAPVAPTPGITDVGITMLKKK